MGKSNVYELPSGAVTIYLDRYCAERLLLALTQALDPEGGYKYYKKKSKKGKGGAYAGMKLSKDYKNAPMPGLKLGGGTYGTGKYGTAKTAPPLVNYDAMVAPKTPKYPLPAPKSTGQSRVKSASKKKKKK